MKSITKDSNGRAYISLGTHRKIVKKINKKHKQTADKLNSTIEFMYDKNVALSLKNIAKSAKILDLEDRLKHADNRIDLLTNQRRNLVADLAQLETIYEALNEKLDELDENGLPTSINESI